MMRVDRFFEFVCVLVRADGLKGPEWDPWYESQSTLDDLGNLATLELPPALFPDANRTRVRLSLLSYCHLTEMEFPYALMANLLRLKLGKKYDMSPFLDLYAPLKKKKFGAFRDAIPPSAGKKIRRVSALAVEAGLPAIADALGSIHDKAVRNAVYHSDYALSEGEFRLLKDAHISKDKGHYSQVVEWEQLSELFSNAFAFYTALFALYDRCTKSFSDFVNAFMPYDGFYKGVLQLLFDQETRITGFRIYWPNQSFSEYKRLKSESRPMNLVFDPDRSINCMVGLYASMPGSFSPLVEHDSQPIYCEVPGTHVRPYWPGDHKVYKLNF